MEAPRTVDEFVAQATREAKTAQDALKTYMDEWASAGRVSMGVWQGIGQAGLRMAFDTQNAALTTSRSMLDTANQSSRAWIDQWAQGLQQAQTATTNLMSASIQLMEIVLPSRRE